MPENNCGFYCPKCGEKADTANPMFIRYSMRHLVLPIFLCSGCRTIYIDKPTIRRIISEWRKDGAMLKKMPFEKLYREFLGEVENLVTNHYVPYLGYKLVRFLKNPPK
ncbi:MAG: hypothetical protein Q8N42_02300 [bacterium]|nr:hypothetical protein [bacterium]